MALAPEVNLLYRAPSRDSIEPRKGALVSKVKKVNKVNKVDKDEEEDGRRPAVAVGRRPAVSVGRRPAVSVSRDPSLYCPPGGASSSSSEAETAYPALVEPRFQQALFTFETEKRTHSSAIDKCVCTYYHISVLGAMLAWHG